MIESVFSGLLYGLVAYILAGSGLNYDNWRFWIIMASMVSVQVMHPLMEKWQ